MGKYIFGPVLPNGSYSDRIKKCIEYIGSLQNSNGSNLAKGIRYLKSTVGCSSNSIKYLYKSVKKYIGHEFDVYGPDVFKFDDKNTFHILKTIVSFVEMHSNDEIKENVFSGVSRPILYSELLYHRQKESLKWIDAHNYKNQRDRARTLLEAINLISDVLQ